MLPMVINKLFSLSISGASGYHQTLLSDCQLLLLNFPGPGDSSEHEQWYCGVSVQFGAAGNHQTICR